MLAVADTHALVWYLLADPRLSKTARATFAQAADSGEPIGVPAVCLVEIIYLTEKRRIPQESLDKLRQQLSEAESVLVVLPLDQNIALAVQRIERAAVPELPDRVIAATALYFGLPLITRDNEIKTSIVKTIW